MAVGSGFLVMGQFGEYFSPIVLADYPPAESLLGQIPCRWAESVHGQIVWHLLEGRMERIFGAGEGPDFVYQALLFLSIVEGAGLPKNPGL